MPTLTLAGGFHFRRLLRVLPFPITWLPLLFFFFSVSEQENKLEIETEIANDNE
jgi:hypothetical protein